MFIPGEKRKLKSREYFEEYWEKHGYDFIGPEHFENLFGKEVTIKKVESSGHIRIEESEISFLKEDFE